jgi:hypothetical protein
MDSSTILRRSLHHETGQFHCDEKSQKAVIGHAHYSLNSFTILLAP